MIFYYKELQKILGVDINEYKKNMSGIYKINEKNGKGRENILNANKVIFEGEYLNGKRKGKGREYYSNGRLKFKGLYLNGKRNGIGKEYYIWDGSKKYEGEYKNGIIWRCKGYTLYGDIDKEFHIKEGKVNKKNII